MFDLSTVETVLIAVWALGIIVAIALISSKRFTVRTRALVLIAALALPVIGSLFVIAYGGYAISVARSKQRKNPSSLTR